MRPVIYFILGCAVLGAIGVAIANRKVDAAAARQRWTKYCSYLVITTLVSLAILNHFFFWLAGAIILGGLNELIKAVNASSRKRVFFEAASLFVYVFIAAGFLTFPAYFNIEFQLAVYFQVLIFDAFSQVSGQLFGRHALVPAISPTKTVEGLIGGFIFCLITSVVVSGMLEIAVAKAMLLGLITSASAFAGDLLASWFKRKMKIKDFSKTLPGQGGVLDRFDSFIVAGFVYCVLSQVTGDFLGGFVK